MMCEEMIFEYWFSTIRKLSARKKYLLRELIGSGKKIYYIEETQIHRAAENRNRPLPPDFLNRK